MLHEDLAPQPSQGASGEAAQGLPPNTLLLDRYVVLEPVARGGMATIYRAKDERLDRIVCLKVLRTPRTSEAAYPLKFERFLLEARTLSRMQHPNTLRIYDFGFLPSTGQPFQVSEYLDGGTLADLVRDRSGLERRETLGILRPMAGALLEAHGAGLLHRDIKPSNIMFSRAGDRRHPKLADFGIADALRGDMDGGLVEAPREQGPSRRFALYSARWAAPEQIVGHPESAATDVYALALVVVYMLSGKALFHDADVRATFGPRTADGAFAASRLAELAFEPRTEAVLAQALARAPEDRPETPEAFVSSLEEALGAAKTPVVQAARAPFDSITVELTAPDFVREAMASIPEVRMVAEGRPIRLVEVDDSVDLLVRKDEKDTRDEARFRIALLPSPDRALRAHVKGLNCFLARTDGTVVAATTSEEDGSVELRSSTRRLLGRCRWFFGATDADALRFWLPDGAFDLPLLASRPGLAVEIEGQRELIVITKRR